MTPAEAIIAKLFLTLTKERIEKAKGAALRAKLDWSVVLAAMTDEQRQAVEHAK